MKTAIAVLLLILLALPSWAQSVAKHLVLPETCPYDYIKQASWDNLRMYIQNGGKLIVANFYHDKTTKQSFIAFEGDKVVRSGLISGARKIRGKEIDILPGQKSPRTSHNHLGIFDVGTSWQRDKDHISSLYYCPMPYSLFYNGGQALHATEKKFYRRLGSPASHGCTRFNLTDARANFVWAAKDPLKVLVIRDKDFMKYLVKPEPLPKPQPEPEIENNVTPTDQNPDAG